MKRQLLRQYLNDSTTKTKPPDFWKKLKPLLPSKKNPIQNTTLIESTRTSTELDVANVLNDHFTDRASKNVPSHNDDFFTTHPSVLAIMSNNTDREFKFTYASVDSIYKLLATLDPKKSSGPNGLSDRTDKARSRPISLLPIISKIAEQVISDQLYEWIKDKFCDSLSGFLKGHSCCTALIKMTEDWCSTLDEKQCVADVTIDLSKAFDSISHGLLTAKLRAYSLADNSVLSNHI